MWVLFSGILYKQAYSVTYLYSTLKIYNTILMSTATYNITGDSGVNFSKTCKIFHSFHHILVATELHVLVLVL